MNNPRTALILSLIAIVGVASVWVLWIAGALKLSVISLDTFVGVIVAILAILVTVILGWQILNALEVQGKMAELEQKQASMLEIERKLAENDISNTKLSNNLQAGICDTNATFYENNRQYLFAFLCLHTALDQAIRAGQSGLDARINHLIMVCQIIPVQGSFISIQQKKQIDRESQSIKESDVYRQCFSSAYDQVMIAFWGKVQVV